MAFQNADPDAVAHDACDNILLPMEVVEPHKRRFRSHRAEYVERGDEAAEDGRPAGL
jgi:NitT/TauT family transport system ATP-binding protein